MMAKRKMKMPTAHEMMRMQGPRSLEEQRAGECSCGADVFAETSVVESAARRKNVGKGFIFFFLFSCVFGALILFKIYIKIHNVI